MKRLLLYRISFLIIFCVSLFAAADLSSAAVSYQFTSVLSQGMRGEGVTALQTVLKEQGYYTYPTITGYFGPSTRAAVIAFQISRGLSPVGSVGPLTRAALNSLQSNPNQPPVVTPPIVQQSMKTTFTRTLKLGSSGDDVSALQTLLKAEGVYTYPRITGYYGSVTAQAVSAFQEKYANEILAPSHLTSGTGNVGPATLTKLNSLSSGILVDNLTPQPDCPAPDISTSLSASGTVGSSFSYTIYATQNPSSYSALNIPAGLSLTGQTISGTPTTNGTYPVTIRATNNCGTDSRTLMLTIGNAGAPTLQLSVSTTTVTTGTSATISWTTTNASSCMASNGWSGSKAISGSENTGSLAATKTFTLTCTGTAGSITQSTTVNVVSVDQNQLPVISMSASPSTVAYGGASTLFWTATNATSCIANSSAWSGSKSITSSQSTGNLTTTQLYRLTCTGPGGTASGETTVTVTQPGALTVSLTAGASAVVTGNSTTLTWASTYATSCTASGAWSGIKATSGSLSVSPTSPSQTYTITCTGAGGSANQSVTITTGSAPSIDTFSYVFSVSPGSTAILTWATTNTTYCEGSGGWSGVKATSGTGFSNSMSVDTVMTLTCGGLGGTTTKSITVPIKVGPPPLPTLPSLSGINAQNILVVYNRDSSDSVALKDYYIGHRPGFSGVNTVGVSVQNIEIIDYATYKSAIETPITNWMSQNSNTSIKAIVLMNGIPSRTSGTDSYGRNNYSVEMRTYIATGAYVSSLDMGSQEASLAYIDKISNGNDISISGSALGKNGTTYYFDEAQTAYSGSTPAKFSKDAVLSANSSASVVYDSENHITSAADVAGYMTWGGNGGQGGTYPLDGTVTFTGKSNWYLIETVESYNGMRTELGQGNVYKWFSANAFGGSNYSNTPVGAVSHTEEPYLSGINNSQYFAQWEQGKTFAEAAWASRMTQYFAAVGDPLVRK